ncbi:MAG: sulfite exporter TauE/SafE family protein [Burkholderiales bacterium]|nr:sulfite exporter TauE/SafE family protein [Burkholderiales bacterium]
MLQAFNFSVVQIMAVAIIVFGAFVVRGLSGFGAGLIAMPLLVFVVPIRTAVPMMGLLVFTLFVFLSIRDRQEVVRDELKRLLPPTILGVIAGALLFKSLDGRLLVMMLGGFIVSFALYSLAVNHFGLPQLRCSRRWALPIGFVSAALDTLFGGGGGTLVVIYMHMRGISKVQFRATVAMLWFFEMIARIASYILSGYYTSSTLLLAALMLPMVWTGTRVGEHIDTRISQQTFSKVLAVMLLLSGISVLLK